MKAYALHNLPVYLYKIACLHVTSGNQQQATNFFKRFVKAQREFHPDEVDNSCVIASGIDIDEAISVANQYLSRQAS